MPILNCTVR